MDQIQTIRRYILVNTCIVLVGLGINQSVQTLGGSVMARVLPNSIIFGEVSLLQQIFGMSGLFLNLGLNSALTYQLSRDTGSSRGRNFGLALYGSVGIGILVAGILMSLSGLLARDYDVPSLQIGLIAGAGLFIFNSIGNVVVAFFTGSRNFVMQSTFIVITTGFSTLGLVFGLWEGNHNYHLFVAVGIGMTSGAVLSAAIALITVHYRWHPTWRLPARPYDEFLQMSKYGIPMWAGNLAKAFQQPFLVMVTGAASVIAAGYLSNALRVVGYLNIVTWAFNVTSLPFLAQTAKDGRQTYLRSTMGFRYNNYMLFGLTALVCAYPHLIALLLFGHKYAGSEATAYIRVLGIGVLFSSVSRLGGTMLAGLGRIRANFWTMIISGTIVLIVAPLVIHRQPLLGAWVYTLGWGLSALTTFWFCKNDGLWMNWRSAFLEPLGATVLLVATISLRALFPDPVASASMFLLSVFIFLAAFRWSEIHFTRKEGLQKA